MLTRYVGNWVMGLLLLCSGSVFTGRASRATKDFMVNRALSLWDMLLIYVLCDTLQFYYVYYAFGKLYFVLCEDEWTTIWRNLPLDIGTSSNGRIPCSGASAALQSSAACSVGRQWSMQRRPGIQCSTYHTIIHSYNHTIKGRLLQFNVVCSAFVSASSPDLSLISTTYRHCNLEYI